MSSGDFMAPVYIHDLLSGSLWCSLISPGAQPFGYSVEGLNRIDSIGYANLSIPGSLVDAPLFVPSIQGKLGPEQPHGKGEENNHEKSL